MNIKNPFNLAIRNKLINKLNKFSSYKINFTDNWGIWTIGEGDKIINIKILNSDFYLMYFQGAVMVLRTLTLKVIGNVMICMNYLGHSLRI